MTVSSDALSRFQLRHLAAVMQPHAAPATVALVFIATLAAFWNGVGPMDSMKYVGAAMTWHDVGPNLGPEQWSLRLPLVLPIALGFAAFGPGDLAAALPNIFYAAGLVIVTYVFGRRHLGDRAGLIAAILVAASPFFVVQQAQVWITGPEIFFVALACWLFVDMYSSEPRNRSLFLIGLLSGAAWLCRETAAFLPACVALLSFLRWPHRIDAIVSLSAGFLAVVGAEMIGYWLAAGDPFYRYMISANHRGAGEFFEAYTEGGESVGLIGWFLLPLQHVVSRPVITPFILLGLATLAAPGFRRALASDPFRRPAIVFGLCGIVSFISAAYGAYLKSPQYYPLFVYACLLTLGVFIAVLYERGRARLAAGALAALLTIGAVTADFRSYDELAEARALADRMTGADAPVTTDFATAARTRLFLRFNGATRDEADTLVLTHRRDAAPCGLVFAATPKGIERAIEPDPGWRAVAQLDARQPRLTHRFLKALGFDRLRNRRLRDILLGGEPAKLYEAPACP